MSDGRAVRARLHVIAADDVLDRPAFPALARALLRCGGERLALHLRAHGRAGGRLYELTRELVPAARDAGALLVVNDRLDVALAAGAGGAQLGGRSLPLAAARRIVPPGLRLGGSVHAVQEAVAAAGEGADWLLLGTIYATPSHPDRPGAGPELVRAVARALAARPAAGAPGLVAIGGLTPERVAKVVAAGAWGVAVLRGIWDAAAPLDAAAAFLVALDAAGPGTAAG